MNTRRDNFDEMERLFDQIRRSMMMPTRMLGGERRFDVDRSDDGFRMDLDFGMDAPFRMGGFGGDANMTLERGEDAHVVLADLPGFETEEIDLRFDGERLTIVAESDEDEHGEELRSRRRRTVRESIRVPGEILAEGIEATYRNGVLEVRLPLAGDGEDGHRIDID